MTSGGNGVGKWSITFGTSEVMGSWSSSSRRLGGEWNLIKIE